MASFTAVPWLGAGWGWGTPRGSCLECRGPPRVSLSITPSPASSGGRHNTGTYTPPPSHPTLTLQRFGGLIKIFLLLTKFSSSLSACVASCKAKHWRETPVGSCQCQACVTINLENWLRMSPWELYPSRGLRASRISIHDHVSQLCLAAGGQAFNFLTFSQIWCHSLFFEISEYFYKFYDCPKKLTRM